MCGDSSAGSLQMAHHYVTADAWHNAAKMYVIEHGEACESGDVMFEDRALRIKGPCLFRPVRGCTR